MRKLTIGFPIVRREQNYEENKIALLAWLKHNAGVSDLSENEKNFISYHIDKFERQELYFLLRNIRDWLSCLTE